MNLTPFSKTTVSKPRLDESRVIGCEYLHYPWDDWERGAGRGLPDLAGLGRLTVREAYQHEWNDRLKSLCGWYDQGRRMIQLALRSPGDRRETLEPAFGDGRLAGRIRRENRPVGILALTLMPWRIPEADIERVKRETDLLALVQSRGVELKKHGAKDFIGRCPFHNDQDSPTSSSRRTKGLWHCMACGKAGNVIQFVQAHDGLSFRHAFEVVARRAARRVFRGAAH